MSDYRDMYGYINKKSFVNFARLSNSRGSKIIKRNLASFEIE